MNCKSTYSNILVIVFYVHKLLLIVHYWVLIKLIVILLQIEIPSVTTVEFSQDFLVIIIIYYYSIVRLAATMLQNAYWSLRYLAQSRQVSCRSAIASRHNGDPLFHWELRWLAHCELIDQTRTPAIYCRLDQYPQYLLFLSQCMPLDWSYPMCQLAVMM